MGQRVFNVARGKIRQYLENVELNNPVAAVIRMMLITSTDTDDVIDDVDTQAALLALVNTVEITNTGYTAGGLVLDETDIIITESDVNNRVDIQLGDQTFLAIGVGGDSTDLVIIYDPDGTNTAANNIPLTLQDFIVVFNGGDVIADEAAAGFWASTSSYST